MSMAALVAYGTSRQHLVGCGLALLGAALALLDPVGPPGLVLVLGFYAVGVAAGRASGATAVGFDRLRAQSRLQLEFERVIGRLPPDTLGQLCRIKDLIDKEVLPGLEALPSGSLDRYLVESTTFEYLPQALEHYLRAAGDDASDRASRDASAPLRVLGDELCLIEGDMRRIAGVVQRTNFDRMLAHRRFLRERFARLDSSG
jgi:hypothetical protein